MTGGRALVARAMRGLRLEGPIRSLAGSLQGVETTEPVLHITFDDGPHPTVTPRILDVLDDFGATATFFMLEGRARAHPDLAAEVLRRGHDVGLHSRTHPHLTTVSWARLNDEIVVARRDLEELLGRPIRWFRPPYGEQDLRCLAMVRASRLRPVLWSVDSFDWKGLPPDDPLERTAPRLRGGRILLMHDTPVDEEIGDDVARGFIAKDQLTALLLEELGTRGIRTVSLEDLLAAGTMINPVKFG